MTTSTSGGTAGKGGWRKGVLPFAGGLQPHRSVSVVSLRQAVCIMADNPGIPGSRDCINPESRDWRLSGSRYILMYKYCLKNVANVVRKQAKKLASCSRVILCQKFFLMLCKFSQKNQIYSTIMIVFDFVSHRIRLRIRVHPWLHAPSPTYLPKLVTLREYMQCLLSCARPCSRRRSVVLYSLPENPETLSRKAMQESQLLEAAEASLKLTLHALKDSVTAHKPPDALKQSIRQAKVCKMQGGED